MCEQLTAIENDLFSWDKEGLIELCHQTMIDVKTMLKTNPNLRNNPRYKWDEIKTQVKRMLRKLLCDMPNCQGCIWDCKNYKGNNLNL